MSGIFRKIAILSCFLFTSFCFWKAGTGLIGGADTEILPSAQAAFSPSFTQSRVVTTPIQEMRPGMRIVGRNPLRIQTEATIDPTPEGWRLVSVRMRKEDGTYFEAELLRPLSWLRRHQAQPGAVIELNMPELHVVGAAEVLSISACPPIDPGDGPVVLSTFKNVATNVLHIYVEGEAEPIGVTAGHPIWSEDRQAFIHSDQLQPGERLRSALGKTVRITSIEIRAGPAPVYNLEVAGEHVYSVTDSGLLVHNIGCEDLSTTIDVYSSNHLVSQYDTINAPMVDVVRGQPRTNWVRQFPKHKPSARLGPTSLIDETMLPLDMDIASISRRQLDELNAAIDDQVQFLNRNNYKRAKGNATVADFDNVPRTPGAQQLPIQPDGYYVRTDIFPKKHGVRRGQDYAGVYDALITRLVHGKNGEVYATFDHYQTFVRIR